MNLLRWMVQRRLCALWLMASGRRDSEGQGAQEKAKRNGLYASAGKDGRETRHVPRNRLSINLPDGVLHGDVTSAA
jgi:hypothetical protein